MNKITDREKKLAYLIQSDLPPVSNFFQSTAARSDMSERDILSGIRSFKEKGILRKFGAILRHQKAGFGKNALVVWSLPPQDVESAGRKFADLPFVSHCYERNPAFQNKYNLFTMLHGKENDIAHLIDAMSRLIHSSDFLILESLQEYKKTSPEYF